MLTFISRAEVVVPKLRNERSCIHFERCLGQGEFACDHHAHCGFGSCVALGSFCASANAQLGLQGESACNCIVPLTG